LKEQQHRVRQAIERGSWTQKAQAIRSLIDKIVVHWATEATTDKRFKSGVRTDAHHVEVFSTAAAGVNVPVMTIEGTSTQTRFGGDSVKLRQPGRGQALPNTNVPAADCSASTKPLCRARLKAEDMPTQSRGHGTRQSARRLIHSC
jgi:hypothetical protein